MPRNGRRSVIRDIRTRANAVRTHHNLGPETSRFISSLPFFFRLDAESRNQTKSLEIIYPHIPLLRYCITRAAHSRRCKLHQRYLLRQSSDPRFVYSRRACLESARAVVQYEGLLGQLPSSIVTARMGIAVHFTHLALVVLVMDSCFNRAKADQIQIKAEVKATLQMFEDDKHASPLLSRFLSSLYHILQKHQVNLNDSLTSTPDQIPPFIHEPNPEALNSLGDDQMQFTHLDSTQTTQALLSIHPLTSFGRIPLKAKQILIYSPGIIFFLLSTHGHYDKKGKIIVERPSGQRETTCSFSVHICAITRK